MTDSQGWPGTITEGGISIEMPIFALLFDFDLFVFISFNEMTFLCLPDLLIDLPVFETNPGISCVGQILPKGRTYVYYVKDR